MSNYSLLFIMADNCMSNPIAPSAAMGLLARLADSTSLATYLLGYESAPNVMRSPARAREWAERAREKSGARAVRVLSRAPGVAGMPANAWRASSFVQRALRAHEGRVILHGRGQKGGYIAARMKAKFQKQYPALRTVFDMRNIEAYQFHRPEETDFTRTERMPPSAAMRAMLAMEQAALTAADAVIVQSPAMAEYLRDEYPGIAFPEPLAVPSPVDTGAFRIDEARRSKLRQAWGVGRRVVLAYSGSASPQSNPEGLARVCGRLAREKPDDFFFLILSPGADALQALFAREDVPPGVCRFDNVAHERVPEFLVGADIGLALHEPTLIARVASSTKLGEYLACGLSVVVSGGLGNAANVLADAPASLVFDSRPATDADFRRIAEMAALHKDDDDARRRANSDLAQRRLSWDANIGQYAELYARLTNA